MNLTRVQQVSNAAIFKAYIFSALISHIKCPYRSIQTTGNTDVAILNIYCYLLISCSGVKRFPKYWVGELWVGQGCIKVPLLPHGLRTFSHKKFSSFRKSLVRLVLFNVRQFREDASAQCFFLPDITQIPFIYGVLWAILFSCFYLGL